MASTEFPSIIVILLANLFLQINAGDRQMICRDVENVVDDQSISGQPRIVQQRMRGKAGPRGPPGLKGERGRPGKVDYERLKASVIEEVQSKLEEKFSHYDVLFTSFNLTLNELRSDPAQQEKKQQNTSEEDTAECHRRGGKLYLDNCFWIILKTSSSLNFKQAKSLCAADGGEPGDISDPTTFDMIAKMARRKTVSSYSDIWTGMKISPQNIKSAVILTSGRTSSFVTWLNGHPSQPSSRTHIGVRFYRYGNEEEGMWSDAPTTTAHGILCFSCA